MSAAARRIKLSSSADFQSGYWAENRLCIPPYSSAITTLHHNLLRIYPMLRISSIESIAAMGYVRFTLTLFKPNSKAFSGKNHEFHV
jgi:hypothetical protein